MRKKGLVSLVILTLLSSGFLVHAADPVTLSGIIVTADRVSNEYAVSSEEKEKWLPGGFQRSESDLGLAGDTNVMDVPYNTQSISAKAMEEFVPANGSIDQVLANSPSVRIGSSPIKTDFSVRGMLANASSIYVNGIPGFYIMCSGPMPNMFDRADVLVGPVATLTGTVQSYNGPDGGQPVSVFLHTKRPDVNLNRITESYSGYGDWGTAFDFSRKDLGANGAWGIRVYGMYDKGDMSISGASRKRRDIFIDVSHKGRKSNSNLFAGSFDNRLWGGERRFGVPRSAIDNGLSHLFGAPDAKKSYDDPHYMHQFEYGNLLAFNHEQKINDHFDWFTNFGMSETTVRRFIYQDRVNLDRNGNLASPRVWSQHFLMKNVYAQAGLTSHFKTGEVKHDFTVALDRSYRRFFNKRKNIANMVSGSIYDGIHFRPGMYHDISDKLGKKFMYQEMDTGLNLVDTMKYNKWTLIAAATRRHGNYTGRNGKPVRDDNWAPTFGLSYAANDDFTVYGSYSKATTRGTVVSADYANAGELLDPVKLTQKEIGVKYKFHDLMAAVSYFDMDQPNGISVRNPSGGDDYFRMNGKNRYKGVDFNLTGKLSKKWNVFGGFEYLHARQQHTQYGMLDGLPTDGSAKWSTVWGLEYKPNEDLSFMGRVNYVGRGVMTGENTRNTMSIPSYTTFDFFASYNTKWGNTPVKLSAACYNAFNKDHWVHQPGQGNKLMLNMPRTYVISASFDF